MNLPFWTIGIMCYNESGSIERVIDTIYNELANKVKLQVLVVDDGSADNSVAIIKTLQPKYPNLDLIAKEQNQGIGSTLTSIYTQAAGEYVVAVPGDGQFDITELLPYLSFEPKTFVNLYRVENTTYSPFRNGLSYLNKSINRILLGIKVRDVNWILLFKTADLKTILPIQMKSNILTSELCAKLIHKEFKVIENQSRYLPRLAGVSRGASFKIVWKAAKETLKLVSVIWIYKLKHNK